MQDTNKKNQTKRRSDSREVLQSKVRLVNRFSLIALTLTSVIALWLVSPSRTMLLTLLAESSSPDVALAFLYALDKSVQDDDSIKYLMFKNHLILNNLVKAEAIILPLLEDDNGNKNWKAFEKYLQLLLVQYSVATTESEKLKKLSEIKSLFYKIDAIPDSNVARFFSDSALSMGFLDKAYSYLFPHRSSSNVTNDFELKKLALQYSNYNAALLHQQNIFEKHQDIVQLKKIIDLFVSIKEPGKAFDFIKQYDRDTDRSRKNLVTSDEFIVLSIEYALLQGDNEYADFQFKKIAKRKLSDKHLSRIINASVAQGNLEIAMLASQRRVTLFPTQANTKQAHDIAIWKGEIFKALKFTHLRVSNNPSEVNIRQAIKESIALGDFSSQGKYYGLLEGHGFLRISEFDKYIKIVELTSGERTAIKLVNRLAEFSRIGNKTQKGLLVHKARLHSYFSEFRILENIWIKLKALSNELEGELEQYEIDLFGNANISLGQPDSALKIFVRNKDWLEQDLTYLQKLFSLAWNTGNKSIAIKLLNEMVVREGYDSSSALHSYRYIQLHQPFFEEDVSLLLALAETWNNQRLLLISIDLAYKNENYTLLDDLLKKVMQDSNYIDDERFIFYAALSAIKQKKNEQVKMLFTKLLNNGTTDESIINSYLWWLIEQSEIEILKNVYDGYKIQLKDKMNFWLVFSAASQKLNRYSEAELWLKKLLIEKQDVSVNAILNYAQLMDVKGDKETAFRLKQYVVNNLSQALFELEPEHYSFISMVKLFSGEQVALPLLEKQVVNNPDQRGTIDLFSYYLQRQDYQRLFLLNKEKYLGRFKLPDWQKLSIALLKGDKPTVENLIRNYLKLPVAQKNYVMQRLGGSANESWSNAWEYGEDQLGNLGNSTAEKELRQVHISQHPHKSHGFYMDYSSFTYWDIERTSLKYYKPLEDGWWDVTLIDQNAKAPLLIQNHSIENEYRGIFNLNFKTDWFEPYINQAQPELLNFKLDVASGGGSIRAGALIGLSLNINDRLQGFSSLGFNQAFEVSQFATLATRNNQLSFGLNYFPTSRESVSLKLNLNDVSTRFGDHVASGWDYSMRFSEKLFNSDPGWEVYFDLVHQEYELEDKVLENINNFYSLSDQVKAVDFIASQFSRLAIGQRLFNGATGQTGAIKSSPSYWLDTSIGLNTLNDQVDFALNSGLGWRLFGDDELSLKLDWQSSDTNGDESLKFSLSYYYNL